MILFQSIKITFQSIFLPCKSVNKQTIYKSAFNSPVVYSTDRSKALLPMLVLLFVTLWFILRGDLF